ncbi:MAG: DEAD/DEAH box helicase family protein, partial [Spirochaetota bacterium]|nr:DEAD/DEAH box helicase family protein [Spirochaetota bacterium]
MSKRELIVSSSDATLADVIRTELRSSDTCIIISAFLGAGLHNMLVREIDGAVRSGKQVKILTSTMNRFNSPEVLRSFQDCATELRIYGEKDSDCAFHVKSYLFLSGSDMDESVIILGSSNFTQMGLTRNKEWNILLRGDRKVTEKALLEFERYWTDESFVPDEDFFTRYGQNRRRYPISAADDAAEAAPRRLEPIIRPNSFQEEALSQLQAFREDKIDRALVVAATGSGKTYLAALDFKQSGYPRALFLAHRGHILNNARQSFNNIIGSTAGSILLSGDTPRNKRRPMPYVRAVFAMVQTLSQEEVLSVYPEDFFDYIVVDEFHHAEAPTYRRIIDHFSPRFMVGLTATPERMDGRDVFQICDYNVAAEIRLFDAIERGLLVPFYYFAIYDETDYSQIRWNGTSYDAKELEELLTNDTRAQLVLNN